MLLAAFFLYNIGFFSFIINIDKSQPPPIKDDHGKADIQYLNEKIARAEKMGNNYGPEEYFSDLSDIRLKEKENDFDRFAITYVQNSVQTLNSFFHNNLTRYRRNSSDAEYKIFMARLSGAQEKHESIVDPEAKQRAIEFKAKVDAPGFWFGVFLSFLSWLFSFYCENLLLAFVLLWLWWYQDRDKIKINNPVSFMVCLVLYPVVIIRVWIQSVQRGARMFAMNIELRRRQANIFALFSEDEWADIKHFVDRDLRLSDYRNYLDNQHLVRRHSLIPVVAVSIFFLLMPSVVDAKGVVLSDINHVRFFSEVHMLTNPPPILEQSCFKQDVVRDNVFVADEVLFLEREVVLYANFIWRFIIYNSSKQKPGFIKNPDPIPLFC